VAVHEIRIDRSKTLVEEPSTGHNRWHPDIPPVVRCEPGDEVVLETRDAFDGQMHRDATLETVGAPNLDVVHPLTGPVHVAGAEPGDLLEVEILEVVPDSYGYTVQVPGFGFLRDVFPEPFMVRWDIADGFATSDDLPGIRVPVVPFCGEIGVAPPDGPRSTIPPDVFGGNMDTRHLTAGTKLFLPVFAPGGRFSLGDGHAAQGDGEVCGTAIETPMRAQVRLTVRKDLKHKLPRAETPTHFITMAFNEDLDDAAKDALRAMIDLIGEKMGLARDDAYMFASLGVDMRVTQLVDGNKGIHAMLPKHFVKN